MFQNNCEDAIEISPPGFGLLLLELSICFSVLLVL